MKRAMTFDTLIIGGGINGCAIAREAALGGWLVCLVEKDDLASHTSSASTKLIHGGLRYLETYSFKMVRAALKERELLLRAAPHLIHPRQFVLPHQPGTRPWLMVRAGLLLYDLLAGGTRLPASRSLRKSDALFRAPLREAGSGFVYSDAWVDDSRLTLLNAIDAARCGALIRTRTALVSAKRVKGHWHAKLSDGSTVKARALVNASGPWVGETLVKAGLASQNRLRLVRGSHIAVDALYAGDHAYMLQQPDKRIVFAFPWLDGLTLIGTTEETVGKPNEAKVSAGEIDYLCAAANRAFNRQISADEVVSSFAGIRPLYDDGADDARAVTRDYVLELESNGAPLLSVFGGKITTARHLAEDALARLGPALALKVSPVSRTAQFPGGNLPGTFDEFVERVATRWPFLGRERTLRMARGYGTQLADMLQGVDSAKAMGRDFGGGLTQIEIDWMIAHEWARTGEDILLRRSKIGVGAEAKMAQAVDRYVKGKIK